MLITWAALLWPSPRPHRLEAAHPLTLLTHHDDADPQYSYAPNDGSPEQSLTLQDQDLPHDPYFDFATAQELAEYMPTWASDIMQNPDQYRRDQGKYDQIKPVPGRTWDDLDDDQGMAAFTPLEIAEDFGVPPDAILVQMSAVGIPECDILPTRPLRDTCSAVQINELSQFLYGADPIELRESFADETIADLARQLGVTSEHLLNACSELKIRTFGLGEDALLSIQNYARLRDYVYSTR